MQTIDRRNFLKKTAVTGLALAGLPAMMNSCNTDTKIVNVMPRWRGFNILDFFNARRYRYSAERLANTEMDFKWMRDWGFDFVRIPLSYPCYIEYDPATGVPITPEETVIFREEAVEAIERVVHLAIEYNQHVSLNLHRAPGYCINAGFREPFNLWDDREAQEAFYVHWDMWSKRFKNVPREQLSFDLVNEPAYKEDMNNQHSPITPVSGEIYRKIASESIDVIHRHNPDRIVIASGNDAGHIVVPELVGLNLWKSNRGYFPMELSSYRAGWVFSNVEELHTPVWPGVIRNREYNRQSLIDFYQPWFDLVKQGVGVHCGECGCFRWTPHDVFLAWFEDTLDIFTEHGIGWGLWNFRGDFGVINSRRSDVDYENWYGVNLDRKLLNLLQKY